MKKLFTLFAMLTLLVSLNAQTISYQAVLRDTIDGKIELVRNQTGEVTFKTLVNVNDPIADVPSVVRNTQIVAVMPFETNADGMVNLPVEVEADGVVDWRDNMIIAEFTYGDNQKIVLVTPVTAVPYAIQAKDGNLTTGTITTYINNSGVADFNDIWKAFKDKEVLEKAVRDSIVEFLKLKENYEIAKKILYSYLNQVSGADVNEAYNTARNLDRATKDTIYSVMKDFLNNHHDLVIDVLEYYAQTATEEEMRAIYEDLKVSVGPAIKEYMNKYFDHYMETKGLVCQGKNLCDAIAAMNAELKCLEISKEGTNFSENACLYYVAGETYRQALNHPENSHWGVWEQGTSYETLWYKETLPNGSSMDLYVNGDHDFLGGNGHEGTFHGQTSDVTWDTPIDPAKKHSFGNGF